MVPTAGDLVHVAASGGAVIAVDNADLQDHDPTVRSSTRVQWARDGHCPRRPPEMIRLTASADGLREASVTIVVQKGVAPATVPPAR